MIGLFSIATLFALAVQTTLARLLPSGMLLPDLALILAVDLGLRHHGVAAALMAFGIGYAIDAFSGTRLGLNALMFTLVFLLTWWLSRALFSGATAIGVIAVFGGVLLCDLGNYYISSASLDPGNLSYMMPSFAIQAALTALCAPWVFGLMGSLTSLAGLRRRTLRE